MNKINIAELLKDCPEGTKLWTPLFGNAILDHSLDDHVTIRNEKTWALLDAYGYDEVEEDRDETAEVMVFPAFDHRTWEDWDTYKVNCIPEDAELNKRPETYEEACEKLCVRFNRHPYYWERLHVLGLSWGAKPNSYFSNKGVPAYAPIITGDGEVDYTTVGEVWGAPAIFEGPSLAVEFGTAFEAFYWELYDE